jgi:glutaredoxin-related protein
MTELDTFKRLKEMVLLKYQEHYPFFRGTWNSFSSQDIQNLIGLIEQECKQSISEKWIYTHLKPDVNHKVPRKGMLDILAVFVGLSSWDELLFQDKKPEEEIPPSKIDLKMISGIALLAIMVFVGVWYLKFYEKADSSKQTIELKNEFTNQKIKNDEVKVLKVQGAAKQVLKVKDGKVHIDNSSGKNYNIEITSPFYKKKVINFVAAKAKDTLPAEVDLKPNDYAMMVKAFMLSDIKDWQTRKTQLNKILSDDLEVLIMLRDDLGAESFNKREFSQKLIVPTRTIKQLKIIEIKSKDTGEIYFIRIKQ